METYLSFKPKTMLLAAEIGLELAFNLKLLIAKTWYIPPAEY